MEFFGVIISILFVFVFVLFSEILRRKLNFSPEFTRKLVHIGVSHWWILAMVFIQQKKYALIPPLLFVFLNFYSYRKKVFKGMERNEKGDLGTVYYPLALIILIFFTWDYGIKAKSMGLLGIMIMGYGDGFAAIVGTALNAKSHPLYKSKKTIEGSLTMFIISFFISAIIVAYFNLNQFVLPASFIIALWASVVEAITPYGADNITVPLVTAFLTYYLSNHHPKLLLNLSIGFLCSFIIAYTAYLKKSLTVDGSIGAVLLGSLIYITTSFFGVGIMIVFFISASLLSSFKKQAKEGVAKQFEKTGCRDIFQVFANGGIGLLFSILYYKTQNVSYLIALAISYAAANADTWSTELGVLNKRSPISLRTLKPVDKGTSGAVSLLGTISGLAGASLIGLFSILGLKLANFNVDYLKCFITISFGGFAGSIIDSILGATVQGIYYSKDQEKETEKKMEDGKQNDLIRGYSFIDNDVVNFVSILLSSLIGLFVNIV